MQETTKLGLKKIELTDSPPDITVFNHNWETLDQEVSDKAQSDLSNVSGEKLRQAIDDLNIAAYILQQYQLPTGGAAIGGVKNGGNISINSSGEMNASTAGSNLGLVKNGGNISVNGSGAMNAPTAGSNLGLVKNGGNVVIDAAGCANVQLFSPVLTKSSTFTLSAADANSFLACSSAAAISVLIPADSGNSLFPIGTEIEVCRFGSAAVTFSANAGVTLYSRADKRSISAQYACAVLKKITATNWLLAGDLA
ncbi:MAG: hypothetical protein ACOX05_01700 [Bacillota bacterium]|jgi:hypothetical protein